MAWQSRMVRANASRYCSHANCEVEFDATVVYPAEVLPDQPPRIANRNCSHFLDCNLQDKAACNFVLQTPRAAIPVDHM